MFRAQDRRIERAKARGTRLLVLIYLVYVTAFAGVLWLAWPFLKALIETHLL